MCVYRHSYVHRYSVCIQLYAYTSFLNHLSASYKYYALLSLNLSVFTMCFRRTKTLSYISHIDTLLFSNSWLIFNYYNNIIYIYFSPRLESHSRLCTASGCPVSLVSFNLVSLSFLSLMFRERTDQVFRGCPFGFF